MPFADWIEEVGEAARGLGAFAGDLVQPSVRLGVTGLSRAGKTVFITALVHNLTAGGRLPFFDPVAQGRVRRVYLEPQPDVTVARFDYERHLQALTGDPPRWPESTRRLSQLRLTIEYEPLGFLKRNIGRSRLHVDIVDYPGEWLLDLPLMTQSYAQWAANALALSEQGERKRLAAPWRSFIAAADATAPAEEAVAARAAELFTDYLRKCRADPYALSTVPPGRFLMPGDLAGSPALTFAPLVPPSGPPARGSLWAMMERRFEAYKAHVVRPFFRDHFARLDRQIVLVDVLAALNAGPGAVRDLERALAEVLACFRTGANTWLSRLLRRRIDRIVFAATKADHLHHTSHDRLEAILGRLTAQAAERARFAGAEVKVLALAAVRATREATARVGGQTLPCILGYPMPGERIDGRTFDGSQEFAIFPGDLPEDPEAALAGEGVGEAGAQAIQVVRFRPPTPQRDSLGEPVALPHIRLDRALNALLADRLS